MNTVQLRAIADLIDTGTGTGGVPPWVGQPVLIRTVTHYYTGRAAAMEAGFVRLDDAAWVASTGRFGEALETGTLDEVEPFPASCWVAVAAIVDVAPWSHPLPRVTQ